MGKLIRNLWIGLLAGTAALTSCDFSTSPPCYYGPPPVEPTEDTVQSRSTRIELIRQRLDAIRDILNERRNAEVYGPPEVIEEFTRETTRLQAEADSLEKELKVLENE